MEDAFFGGGSFPRRWLLLFCVKKVYVFEKRANPQIWPLDVSSTGKDRSSIRIEINAYLGSTGGRGESPNQSPVHPSAFTYAISNRATDIRQQSIAFVYIHICCAKCNGTRHALVHEKNGVAFVAERQLRQRYSNINTGLIWIDVGDGSSLYGFW